MKYISSSQYFPSKEVKQAYEKLTGHSVSQMRIVVKSKGRKDAERICNENNLYMKFIPNYSGETGNQDEIAKCDSSESGIILSRICGTKEDTVTLEQIKEVL